jgi:transglutaminase-like putative cysteine protease
VAKPTAAAGRRELVLVGSTAPVPPMAILRGLVLSALALCGVTVVLSAVTFLLLPRWSVASFEMATTEPLRMVGYSKTVTLGELGEVVNNPDLVARITLFRGHSNRPLKLAGEPLFRGTVVTRYEGRTWSQPSGSHPLMLPTEVGSTVTRQRIRMEPMDVGEVFCIAPVVAIDQPDTRVRLDTTTGQLLRLEEERNNTLDIDIGTTGILGNRQRTVLPCPRMFRDHIRSMLQPFAYEDGRDQFPALTALATRILADKNIDPATDRVRAARALSDYFHQSGEFFYTLEPQNRDPKLDPLEDFVSRNRSGHCEYFAGALVLMLRSQGIPARMVIGFKGGEWNSVGMYYQVQQLHAHTWVEAHLNEDQIPDSEFAGERMPRAAWLVLDPTEGTREVDPTAGVSAIITRVRQFVDYARVLWINYVASLNSKRQRQGIYEPLAAGIEAGYDHLTSVEVWQDRLNALNRSFVGRFWHWYRRHWFSWRGGLVAVGFSLCVVGVAFSARALRRFLLRRGWWGQQQLAATQPMLEMYRRLEAALARVGLTRPPAQTAYEFALAAGGELSEQVEHRRLAHLPRRVVESFYRVRFGNRPLDTQEAEAVENALAELERSLPR